MRKLAWILTILSFVITVGVPSAGASLTPEDELGYVDHWGYINTSGEMVIPVRFKSAGRFSEGLAPVLDASVGKWGYIDKSGQMVIQPRYTEAKKFSEGMAPVRLDRGLDTWAFIDRTGKVVAPTMQYTQVWPFHNGRARVMTAMILFDGWGWGGTSYGFIDKTGKVVVPLKYTSAGDFCDGLAPVRDKDERDGRWGYIGPNGKMIIKQQYFRARQFSEGLAYVMLVGRRDTNGWPIGWSGSSKHGTWGYIDPKGKMKIKHHGAVSDNPFYPGGRQEFHEGLAVAGDSDKYVFIDRSGHTVMKPYKETGVFSEGLCFISNGPMRSIDQPIPGSQWSISVGVDYASGYIDRSGKKRIALGQVATGGLFSEGLAAVAVRSLRTPNINANDYPDPIVYLPESAVETPRLKRPAPGKTLIRPMTSVPSLVPQPCVNKQTVLMSANWMSRNRRSNQVVSLSALGITNTVPATYP